MALRGPKRAVLLSFSGMDGAGKSTQITNLCEWIAARGDSVRVLSFWDDVVVLARWREGFVHKVFKSERGIGAPGKPVRRRDKNIRKWYLTPLRLGLYLLDAISLRRAFARARQGSDDFVIFDRYIYDELSNLAPGRLTRFFVRFVDLIVPRPDIAFVLDADPAAAVERKPEYPLDFMQRCQLSYLRLAAMLDMHVVPPLPLHAATGHVEDALEQHLSSSPAPVPADALPAA